MGVGALWAVSLQELVARRAVERTFAPSPYGEVEPTNDQTTGLPLLLLPPGFTYLSTGWTGDRMSDGIRTPGSHDGMAVIGNYGGNPGLLTLVRNHESSSNTTFGTNPALRYSPNSGGGTTNLIFDVKRGRFVKTFSSLAGTRTNCAGGVTPWGTWITCEETTATSALGTRTHGWCFEVGPNGGDPTPLTAMGRFSHEAIMIDASPTTGGTVYLTEDAGGTSGFYKFVPNVHGDLKQGGELFMLKVKGVNQADLRFVSAMGTIWDVEWVKINNPASSPYAQGFTAGAARFNRLEGAWWGWKTGYFLSTSGGSTGEGQVFEFDPGAQTLRLIYNSSNFDDCDNPDNMVVTPQGQLLLCEDGGGGAGGADRLIGLTLAGTTFTFARNNMVLPKPYNDLIAAGTYRTSELAGACFSPDGKWLFVNQQTPGVTYAITGPWHQGPL